MSLYDAASNHPAGEWFWREWISVKQEYKFHPSRKWRFDFAWPSAKVAVEIQGGGFRKLKGRMVRVGHHSNPKDQQDDFDKLTEAQRLGWLVIQFSNYALRNKKSLRAAVQYVATILQERIDAETNKRQLADPDISMSDILYGKRTYRELPEFRTVTRIPLPARSTKPPKPVARTRKSMD